MTNELNITSEETTGNIAETSTGESTGGTSDNKIVPIANKTGTAEPDGTPVIQPVTDHISAVPAPAAGTESDTVTSAALAAAAEAAATETPVSAATTQAASTPVSPVAAPASGTSVTEAPVSAVTTQAASTPVSPIAASASQIPANPAPAASASTSQIPANPALAASASVSQIPANPAPAASASTSQIPADPAPAASASTSQIPADPAPAASAASDSAQASESGTSAKRSSRLSSYEERDYNDFDFDDDERPKRRFFRSRHEEESRDRLILSRIKDEDLMEYLTLEQRRIEFLQHAKELREKRLLTAFQLLISLAAIVAVTYLLKDNPTILISILYIVGIVAALNIWKNPHDKGKGRR